MSALEPLIEGYLSYLTQVRRLRPRTVIDVRCTLRRAVAGLDRLCSGVPLWHARLDVKDSPNFPGCVN